MCLRTMAAKEHATCHPAANAADTSTAGVWRLFADRQWCDRHAKLVHVLYARL
jgi:hypothetical protein